MKKKNHLAKQLWNVMSKKDRAKFIFLMFLGLISSFAVLVPTQVASAIISMLSGEKIIFFGFELKLVVDYVWFIIIGGVLTYLMDNLNRDYRLSIEKLIKKTTANLRVEAFGWLTQPRKNMDLKMTQGDAIYRMNQTPDTLNSNLVDLFAVIIPDVLSASVAFVYISILDITSMALLVLGMVLVAICVAIRTSIDKKLSLKIEKSKSAISSMTSNTITNLPIINLYKSMAYESKIFKEKVDDYYGEQKKSINVRWAYWRAVTFIETCIKFVIIFICAKQIYAKSMIVGNVIVVTNYVTHVFSPVQEVGYYIARFVQGLVEYDRLEELKAGKNDVLNTNEKYNGKIETIELQNISAENGENFQISKINAKFEKGQFIVLSGESGTGKTTLIKLICGLCEKTNGSIVVNGIDKINSAYSLAEKMSVSMQDAYIFNRDVKLNILYPDGTAQLDYEPIIKQLSLQNVIDRKFDENVDQNFANALSGGEKKRIGISRAMIKPADVYIFDEPTNDLDAKNANNVIKIIDNLKKDAIVIVVSHDDRVLQKADKIIKFERHNGKTVAILGN